MPYLHAVADTDPALLGVLRDDEAEMGAHDALADAGVGGNVIAGAQI